MPSWYEPAPRDSLREVFTPEVMAVLRSASAPSKNLLYRLEVLQASGPYPSDARDALSLRYLRARKAAWEAYIETAFVCGLFRGERGKELRGRFASQNDDNFRSAMAECAACWFLAGARQLAVKSEGLGRDSRKLDLAIARVEGDVGVEVKAPLEEPPPGGFDHSQALAACLDQANKQFSRERPNVLFIVPTLSPRVFEWRHFLVKAFIGQDKITWAIDTRTGRPVSNEPRNVFYLDGKFTQQIKAGKLPGFTRVSVVVCMEERFAVRYPHPNPLALAYDPTIWPEWKRQQKLYYSQDNQIWIEHDVLVVHNPFAEHPLPESMWNGLIQFIREGDAVKWNDGHALFL